LKNRCKFNLMLLISSGAVIALFPVTQSARRSSERQGQGRRRFMKRLAREQKKFLRRWYRDSGSWFGRAALLGTAFLFGMVAA
jgi:hypothetical protein